MAKKIYKKRGRAEEIAIENAIGAGLEAGEPSRKLVRRILEANLAAGCAPVSRLHVISGLQLTEDGSGIEVELTLRGRKLQKVRRPSR